MFAEVLTVAASWQGERPLLTYEVPAELEGELQPGQLVAVPYGERLVEGIIWQLVGSCEHSLPETLRPVHALLDPQPVLLSHQRALAEWMADYYVTSLALVVQLMLPPGLLQGSRAVLTLVNTEPRETASLSLQALIGLLLDEGEIDVARLQAMLGPTRARALLKEAVTSGLIERVPRLAEPRLRPRRQRAVRLCLAGEELAAWKRQLAESLPQYPVTAATSGTPVDLLPPSPSLRRRPPSAAPLSVVGSAAQAPIAAARGGQGQESQRALRALAAIDLLEHSPPDVLWTPSRLARASGLTQTQLQQLVAEGVLAIEEDVEVRRDPLRERPIVPSSPLRLTSAQEAAVRAILAPEASQRPLLLHGVTGSGKTEVYLQALAALIARGQKGLVLVPEIAITAQAIQRIAGRFPGRVAIIHSALSPGERYDEWRRIRAGQVDVVLGSRSALFVPLPDLGIIILDEEHETAYKQEERRPTYHAREVACTLGRLLDIPVVLGSATPSVTSFYRAQQGAYQLVELPERIGVPLPPVEIVDLRSELHAGNTSILSRRLRSELENVLARRQQAILYLNRRGAASCVLCRECGYVAMCEHCDVPLTYHATERILLCHYCNLRRPVLTRCPHCNNHGLRYFGIGTEKVEQAIQQTFPQARLLRWDRDTARTRRAHEQLLDRFANHEADILIGTQMIAKGLDLPGVTLVGVVAADIALMLPDFAATERAFTLLTQVAGRAGRGSESGLVIIQTFNPEHFAIETASRHAYHEFYAAEIILRQRYAYPPFRQFVKFTYSHTNRRRAQNEALLLREQLDRAIAELELEETDIVGPAPAVMERIRDEFRWQMIARGPDLRPLLRAITIPPGWHIDIDPVSTM
ncbi:replication restart helicase PriA [Thermogemmatispora carboxidivorans]|uniref:replication restart helicase PriA n=1 Tax=Thermogemmatispora carboxidivorans TaxID=1382306 RepID=UPI00069BB9FA|nr:primosomal protein N' [Thermogemmatispora carboxidivorans]